MGHYACEPIFELGPQFPKIPVGAHSSRGMRFLDKNIFEYEEPSTRPLEPFTRYSLTPLQFL